LSSLAVEIPSAPAASRPGPPAPEVVRVKRAQPGWTSPETILMGSLLAVSFAGLFFRWFWRQHLFSAGAMQDWGHAYIIPLISGYLIWMRRQELASVRPTVFWPGLAPMLLGIMSYFFFVGARVTGGHMIQGWAMLLTLFGVVLLMAGPRAMRHLFLPVAFLVFGITISEMVMIRLTFPLQLVASQGAYVVLSVIGALTGFTADLAGNNITVISSSGAAVPLSVAEACSGMRMVIAFLALGGALALLTLPHWWQRVVLMLTAAPVAILLNIGRVSVLGVASLANPEFARGEAHMLIGQLLLVPGLFLFLAIGWALKRVVKPQEAKA
jgi:exosortase